MTVSRQPQITEELLSAYLDDQVTAEERALVEAAIATDPAIAWQVDSLRQTVHLLQALPPLALPRTFTLEAILAEARAAETTTLAQPEVVIPTHNTSRRPVVRMPVTEEPETTWWQWFLQLWQGGNLQLRNAAAVAFTLFFVLFAGDRLLVPIQPMAEVTPTLAPIALTPRDRVAETAVTPTVESSTTTATATTMASMANSSAPSVDNTADNAIANPPANTAAQSETHMFQAESSTSAAAAGAPGPREQDLTGGSESSADAVAATGFRGGETGERSEEAKSMALAAVVANNPVTQEIIAAEPPLTTAVAVSVTEVVTNADATSLTALVTVPLTAVPTATVDSVTLITAGTPATDERVAWLPWAQMITALSTVVLAGLWWRSRR